MSGPIAKKAFTEVMGLGKIERVERGEVVSVPEDVPEDVWASIDGLA